jgi:hypothetical protein
MWTCQLEPSIRAGARTDQESELLIAVIQQVLDANNTHGRNHHIVVRGCKRTLGRCSNECNCLSLGNCL